MYMLRISMRDLYAYLLFKLEESHIWCIIISFATPEAIFRNIDRGIDHFTDVSKMV